LVIPEPAETEMASVLEEVTPDYAVTEVAQVAYVSSTVWQFFVFSM
jgi:hypothetical protein